MVESGRIETYFHLIRHGMGLTVRCGRVKNSEFSGCSLFNKLNKAIVLTTECNIEAQEKKNAIFCSMAMQPVHCWGGRRSDI